MMDISHYTAATLVLAVDDVDFVPLARYDGLHLGGGRGETIRVVDTSSTAMSARTTSVLKDLGYRCVGLAGNNLELAGNGKPKLQARAIRSRFSG